MAKSSGGLAIKVTDDVIFSERGENPHVMIPLLGLGKFKNEDGERLHKMLAASVIKSGFQVRAWSEAVAELLQLEGNLVGLAICNKTDFLLPSEEVIS